jgi:hypothetical protein
MTRPLVTPEPPILDYDQTRRRRQPIRVWGLSGVVWWLLAGCCGFLELAGNFATNGRINGWGDVAFVIGFAAIGIIALVNGLRAVRWSGRRRQRGG